MIHQPVMLGECMEGLAIKPDGIYIDGTFGRGGHSQEILARLSSKGRLIAFDKDPSACDYAKTRFANDQRFEIVYASFANAFDLLKEKNLIAKVDGILLDLGVSSPQLDDPLRGFSFLKEGPLDMRMDPNVGESAASFLSRVKESELADILYQFGEEKFSRRIARAIVSARNQAPIKTTTELAEIIKSANPAWEKHKHPATRSFQAIRIFINRELHDIEQFLHQALAILKKNGRLVVLTFHSLEDRLIKRFMRKEAKGEPMLNKLPLMESQLKREFRIIGKALKPSFEETKQNHRARSAVLRIGEKIA